MGVWFLIQRNLSGIWFFLLGLFLRNAAQMSYQQLLLRHAFEGEPVARFMQTNPVTVPRQIPHGAVQDYISATNQDFRALRRGACSLRPARMSGSPREGGNTPSRPGETAP